MKSRILSLQRPAHTHRRRLFMAFSKRTSSRQSSAGIRSYPGKRHSLVEIFANCTAVPNSIPPEVARAMAVFEAAYEPIRAKVKRSRQRYRDTKYEDCPPTLKEEFRFFTGTPDIWAAQQLLLKRYGHCSFSWAYFVGWHRQERRVIRARSRARQSA